MSQKLSGQFGFLEVADTGSPGGWLRVGGVSAINDLRSGTSTEIDVSDLQSLSKEYLLGLNDPGSANATVFYDPADPGQIQLETLRETSAINGFRVGVRNPLSGGSPTGYTVFSFSAFVQSFPFSVGVDAAVSGTVTMRISGPITKQ